MSIVDLTKRITTDWNEFNEQISLSESKIFVDNKVFLDNDCPASLLLTVGDAYLTEGTFKTIPVTGVKVPPNKTVVFETRQKIALPYNVFGLVTGVGVNIFNSGFVSSGKIDSGFCGKLKIAYFNGSDKTIVFKQDDVLSCCSFWNTDYTIKYQLQDYHANIQASIESQSKVKSVLKWFGKNWYSVLALAVSIAAIVLKLS